MVSAISTTRRGPQRPRYGTVPWYTDTKIFFDIITYYFAFLEKVNAFVALICIRIWSEYNLEAI